MQNLHHVKRTYHRSPTATPSDLEIEDMIRRLLPYCPVSTIHKRITLPCVATRRQRTLSTSSHNLHNRNLTPNWDAPSTVTQNQSTPTIEEHLPANLLQSLEMPVTTPSPPHRSAEPDQQTTHRARNNRDGGLRQEGCGHPHNEVQTSLWNGDRRAIVVGAGSYDSGAEQESLFVSKRQEENASDFEWLHESLRDYLIDIS